MEKCSRRGEATLHGCGEQCSVGVGFDCNICHVRTLTRRPPGMNIIESSDEHLDHPSRKSSLSSLSSLSLTSLPRPQPLTEQRGCAKPGRRSSRRARREQGIIGPDPRNRGPRFPRSIPEPSPHPMLVPRNLPSWLGPPISNRPHPCPPPNTPVLHGAKTDCQGYYIYRGMQPSRPVVSLVKVQGDSARRLVRELGDQQPRYFVPRR